MSGRTLSVLAFEPFDDGSHRAVRESISRHSRHRWRWLTRPGRAWKWRMRLAAIELAAEAAAVGAFDDPVDLIFVTSLCSAADLRAMLPPALRGVPLVLYMHENQLAYPAGPAPTALSAERDAHFGLTNLTSALAADLVIWNSGHNRDSFAAGIEGLLRHAPDTTVRPSAITRQVAARSEVLWPPVEPPPDGGGAGLAVDLRVLHKPIRVVWPHRWEHDKGPGELLELARRWSEPLDLRWTILGQQFREVPPELARFEQEMSGRIDHFGHEPDRDAYWRHLQRCDWVCSTAHHEFFGIAVVEALLAGCLPWLPQRLSYPELLPEVARGLTPAAPVDDPGAIRAAVASWLSPAVAPEAVKRIDDALSAVVP